MSPSNREIRGSYLKLFGRIAKCHKTHDPNQNANRIELNPFPKGPDIYSLRIIATTSTTYTGRIQPIPEIDAFNVERGEFTPLQTDF